MRKIIAALISLSFLLYPFTITNAEVSDEVLEIQRMIEEKVFTGQPGRHL